MKVISNEFKVNLDNKDILVTEEQRRRYLHLHNQLKDATQYMLECKDITLSQVSMLEELEHQLHDALKFSPQKDEDGKHPNYYTDFVLSEDELAWKRENDE